MRTPKISTIILNNHCSMKKIQLETNENTNDNNDQLADDVVVVVVAISIVAFARHCQQQIIAMTMLPIVVILR